MSILWELTKPIKVFFETPVSDDLGHGHLVKVSAVYDGKSFEGVGPTKYIARDICSEAIIQYITFKACDKESKELSSKSAHAQSKRIIPWTALASLALFKMLNDWQVQGAVLPQELMNGKDSPTVANPTRTKNEKGQKKLPQNAASLHPVSILQEMLGTMEYKIVKVGQYPNKIFEVSVIVKDKKFTGRAKSMKEARRNCAAEAMRNIFGVNYPPVNKSVQKQ